MLYTLVYVFQSLLLFYLHYSCVCACVYGCVFACVCESGTFVFPRPSCMFGVSSLSVEDIRLQ